MQAMAAFEVLRGRVWAEALRKGFVVDQGRISLSPDSPDTVTVHLDKDEITVMVLSRTGRNNPNVTPLDAPDAVERIIEAVRWALTR